MAVETASWEVRTLGDLGTASASRGDLVWTGSSFVLKTRDLTCPTGHSRR